MSRVSRDQVASGSYSFPRNSGEPPSAGIVYKTPPLLQRIRPLSGDHAGEKAQPSSSRATGSAEPTRIFASRSLLVGEGVQLKAIHRPSGDQVKPPTIPGNWPSGV